MRRFELVEPRSLEEACQILAEHEDVRLIAGGTALLILIKHGIFLPKTLINLKKVRDGSNISYDPATGLRIGALASIYDVETTPAIRQHYPVLAQACHVVANIRIRNMATIGGNLAHADYQSDPPAVLIALDARLELTKSNAKRALPLAEFLRGSYETALERDEIVSAIVVPPPMPATKGIYIRFTTRSSEDRPCAGIAAMVRMKNGTCEEGRLVVGAVSPTPVRVQKAEEMARGERFTPKLIEEMASMAARAVDPIEDLRGPADYKRHIVQVLTGRALTAISREGRAP